MTDKRYRGIVVAHTHWDRAWYLPFQRYRQRLVRLLDRLLEALETDPAFRAFTLDGQTVLLEDYLEIRPEQKPRLQALVRSGRLAIGPWYALPDLFLASGEAIVRNLQAGLAMVAAYGGGDCVGYVPDPFGHFAQMPQVLRGFGLDAFVFMRGLSAEAKASCGGIFTWVAPDGSQVLAVYQPEGYFPVGALGHPHVFGRFDGHQADRALAKTQVLTAIAKLAPLQQERSLLLSNGFDHMPPQLDLPALLADLNRELTDKIDLQQGTLGEFIRAIHAENLPHQSFTGDLIGNDDHPILASVFSARLYLKQQNHQAQGWLVNIVEPLSAWLEAKDIGTEDAGPLLAAAWKLLLRNHPHDDICGCSVDPVHEDGEVRFRQVNEIAEGMAIAHLEALLNVGFAEPVAEAVGSGDRYTEVFVFNPHPWEQVCRIKARILFPNPDGEWGEPTPERVLVGCDGAGNPVEIQTQASVGREVRSRYLETTWGRRYDICFTVAVPPLGYQLIRIWESGRAPAPAIPPECLESNWYRLEVRAGHLVLTEKATGITFTDPVRFEYQLDNGDTYSFGPVPEAGPWWAEPLEAVIRDDRPDTICLTHRLTVPASYADFAAETGRTTTLTIASELRLNEQRSVSLTACYRNTAKDGRLRAVFPLGFATRCSLADGHFRLAERVKPHLRTPESDPERYRAYPGELDYPTHHQGDFAIATGEIAGQPCRVWAANRGLPEYEILAPEAAQTSDGSGSMAVTLHRAVGYLSVENGRIRRCQAGPSVPTPGAQCQREIRAELAYGVGAIALQEIARLARAFAHPAWVAEMPLLPYLKGEGGDRALARQDSFLAIDNPWVALSACKPGRDRGECILRIYNFASEPQTALLRLGFPATAWCVTDLYDTWQEANAQPVVERAIAIELQPHQIVTIALRTQQDISKSEGSGEAGVPGPGGVG